MAKLTAKQRQFCLEYIVDFNATEAAIRAGYSAKTATAAAARMLTIVNIASEIQKNIAERRERTKIEADRVLQEMAAIGFSNIKKVASWAANGVTIIDSEDISDDVARAVAQVTERTTSSQYSSSTTINVKMHDKCKALDMMAKHLGMYQETKKDEGAKEADAIPEEQIVQFLKQA